MAGLRSFLHSQFLATARNARRHSSTSPTPLSYETRGCRRHSSFTISVEIGGSLTSQIHVTLVTFVYIFPIVKTVPIDVSAHARI